MYNAQFYDLYDYSLIFHARKKVNQPIIINDNTRK